MTAKLEYHIAVRRSVPASIALFSLIALPGFFLSISAAQINAPPTSVTSPGFGGRAVNGPPSSVTSLGPRGYTPGPRVTFSAPRGTEHEGHRRHHNFVEAPPAVVYAVPVPYAVDGGAPQQEAEDEENDPDYQGGPTIFDRRGSGADSYVPPVRNFPAAFPATRTVTESAAPEPPSEPTLLVFRDGHKLEVSNYAIIGETLFDLTPGHVRRVALSALDLDETRKQNDDHGVVFQLPPAPLAN